MNLKLASRNSGDGMLMKRNAGKAKGFTLIELMIAMGLAFLIFAVIYMAYFISQTFFVRGTDSLQEQMYVRALFSGINDDLKYLTRLNELGPNKDYLVFEIFNRKVVGTQTDTSNKTIQGSVITYQLNSSKDYQGNPFMILQKKEDKYEWLLQFGHTQVPDDLAEPYGYPPDYRDASSFVALPEGQFEDMIEQEEKKEFLVTSVIFTPYDNLGEEIVKGNTYEDLRYARSIKVEVTYSIRNSNGDLSLEKNSSKTVSTVIPFVNFMVQSDVSG